MLPIILQVKSRGQELRGEWVPAKEQAGWYHLDKWEDTLQKWWGRLESRRREKLNTGAVQTTHKRGWRANWPRYCIARNLLTLETEQQINPNKTSDSNQGWFGRQCSLKSSFSWTRGTEGANWPGESGCLSSYYNNFYYNYSWLYTNEID